MVFKIIAGERFVLQRFFKNSCVRFACRGEEIRQDSSILFVAVARVRAEGMEKLVENGETGEIGEAQKSGKA